MALFTQKLFSKDQEISYRSFMLQYETYSLRTACLIGSLYHFIFLIIDYWRADHYKYVIVFRVGMIILLLTCSLFISRIKFSYARFDLICLFISGAVVFMSFFMDFTAGMPQYFLPNFFCLLLYVFNTGLGYPLKPKTVFTTALLISYLLYAQVFSPHPSFHLSQTWNIGINIAISILIGFLIERYKRINFIQRNELKKTQNDIRAIFDSAFVSIIKTDTTGIITHFNKGAERLLGYSSDEIIGKHSPALFHLTSEVTSRGLELSQLFKREIKEFDVFVEFAKLGKPEIREWTYLRKDGSSFPVQLVVTAVRGLDEQIVGFLGIATDITELNNRSIIIQHQKSELETLNNTKDRFFSIVAHDLKSPLNSLKAFSGLLTKPLR